MEVLFLLKIIHYCKHFIAANFKTTEPTVEVQYFYKTNQFSRVADTVSILKIPLNCPGPLFQLKMLPKSPNLIHVNFTAILLCKEVQYFCNTQVSSAFAKFVVLKEIMHKKVAERFL
jgi:hypothetical protein